MSPGLRRTSAVVAITALAISGAKIAGDHTTAGSGFSTVQTAAADPTGPTGGPGDGGMNGSQFQPPGLPPQQPDYQGGINQPPLDQNSGISIYNTGTQGTPQQGTSQSSQQGQQGQQPQHGTQIPDYQTATPYTQGPGKTNPDYQTPQQGQQQGQQPQQGNQQQPSQAPTQTQQPNQQDQQDRELQQKCEQQAQYYGIFEQLRSFIASSLGGTGNTFQQPSRKFSPAFQCNCAPQQTGPQKQSPEQPDKNCSIKPDRGIQVPNSALASNNPALNPRQANSDPEFGKTQLNWLERSAKGNAARVKAKAASDYMAIRGWTDASTLMEHYLANEDGGPSPSVAKSLTFPESIVDKFGKDLYNGAYGKMIQGIPDLLTAARQEALNSAKKALEQCGSTSFTEVFGNESDWQGQPGGWFAVAGSDPDTVYSLGRYSAQIVTQVNFEQGNPSISQRFYIYDVTDFAHPEDAGSIFTDPRSNAIDSFAFLRDIGWARIFNTYGASSIQNFK